MSTVIDSLVVTLGLDPKNFRRGSAETNKQLDETKARAKSAGEEFENLTRKVGSLFALFTAGVGIKQFIADTTAANTQLARFARNVDLSTSTLSAWERVAERSGGSAADFQGTISGLSSQMTELAVTGQSAILPYMRALGISLGDAAGRARPLDQILLDIADRFQGMNRVDANNIGKMMGIDQGTLNALLQGRAAVEQMLARQNELLKVTGEQTKNAEKLAQAWFDFRIASRSAGNDILGFLTPALTKMVEWLTIALEYLNKHRAVLIGVAVAITTLFVPAFVAAASAIWGMLAPLLLISAPILAAVAALTLLADDWWTWLNGGESALSGLWDTFAEVIHKIENAGPLIVAAIGKAFAGARDAATDAIFGTQSVIGGIIGGAKGVVNLPPGPRSDLMNRVVQGAVGGFAAGAAGGRENEAVDFFRRNGWTTAQAAGIAANLQRESNYNPNASGDNGQAYGIGQWHPDRQAAFKKWSGKDIRDSSLTDQLAFVHYELTQGTERGAGNRLRATTDAGSAGAVVSQYYERPGDVAGESTYRAAQARLIASGAASTRNAAAPSYRNSSTSTQSSSSEVNIGSITVTTQATDAKGVAAALPGAIRDRGLASQADYGVN